MKRRLTSRAFRDIENILTYIHERDTRAAETIGERIEHIADARQVECIGKSLPLA